MFKTLQIKQVKPSKEDEKKSKKTKEKTLNHKKEKTIRPKERTFQVEKDRTSNKKNALKKTTNKKYKLVKSNSLTYASSDDDGDVSMKSEASDNDQTETETEYEAAEAENDCNTDDNNESEEELAETQPFFGETPPKRKKPPMKLQKPVKKPKEMKKQSSPTAIYEGWTYDSQVATRKIDFNQWQASHPNRENFFVGPDSYVYNNASTMKKFIDVVKKKQLDERIVSIPIKPMSKVVATNPRIKIGLTGSRYILSNGGGFGVSPIFYIAKEYVSCVYFAIFKTVKNMLLFFYCR